MVKRKKTEAKPKPDPKKDDTPVEPSVPSGPKDPEPKPDEKVAADAPKKGAKAVDVIKVNGRYVRTYSEKRHSKKFKELAAQFAERRGYSVVDSKKAGTEDEK